MIKYSEQDLDIATRTVWAEARGEGRDGQIAVAWVIRNRAENPRWWSRNRDDIPDDTIAAVCIDPWQFSCWNANDLNRPKLLALPKTDPLYQRIEAICRDVFEGKLPDPTKKADHYLVRSWIPRTKWAVDNPDKKTYEHGSHVFYRLELKP